MLSPEDPRAGLRRLFARLEPRAPVAPPAGLEARLLAQHARLHPPRAHRGAFAAFLGAHRFAASGAALALVVGACQLPAEYQRSFGVSFACTASRAVYEGQDSVPDLADRLSAAIEAVRMSLRVHDDGGPTLALRIDAWGPVEDHAAALAAIRAAAPVLKDARCESEPLAGTVHGTLGGRLGYALLDLDIDRKGAELTRTEIREQLHAQGFTGTAEVEVEESPGQRRVEIRLEQHHSSEAVPEP